MTFINAIRSILFNIIFYLFSLIYIPSLVLLCLWPNDWLVRRGIAGYCLVCKVIGLVIMGIRWEYRGLEKLPKDGALILLSKHQSYLDPILAFKVRNDITALAKRELFDLPFLGHVFKKAHIIRVDRKSRKAHEAMPAAGKHVRDSGSALIVYPEATRVPVGQKRRLKSGAYYLQRDHDLPVYPVATNAGLFWSKGFWHKPGTAIYEIGDPFPADLSKEDFMDLTEKTVVSRSDILMQEAGYTGPLGDPKKEDN